MALIFSAIESLSSDLENILSFFCSDLFEIGTLAFVMCVC
jgi:hypothetical protein